MKLTIATRKSPLALWQAEHVKSLLASDAIQVSLLKMTTRGDKILDQALSKINGKDLFVKEIEHALISGQAQIAVHPLKDMPTLLTEGLAITLYPKREDPRDALVSSKGYRLNDLPQRAKVGTCSLRRAAQLLRLRPDLQIDPIRGNVQTRLRKMEEEGMDATILAYAGLLRLEMAHLATEVIDPSVSQPAIGQGILAVETRTDDAAVNALVKQLDDPPLRAAAISERSFLHRLEGGCQVPIAGHAKVSGDRMTLEGLVASLDGREVVQDVHTGPVNAAAELGVELANRLLAAGAKKILDGLQER